MASLLGNAITAAITFDISGATSALNNLNKEVNNSKGILEGIGNVGSAITDVGTELTKKVTLPIVALGTAAVTTAADFESAISRVAALSGASADEVQLLSEKARELGANTVFSAKEVAEGFQYMALAGWDTQQSLDGIESVLLLAAGAELDLATTSDIVTDALTAFGLEAEDTARFTDVLSQTMTNSNTDVSQLGEAFKYVAPLAGTLGFSIEDVGVALGLMANAGVKGSQAGTALRQVLQSLSKPTDEQAALLEQLGVSLFDSEGNAKELSEVLGDLRTSFSGLTDEQQANYATTLFGARGMSGLLPIINASQEEYDALTDAVNNAEGATRDLYDIQTDNLKGSFAELKSATEEVLIAFGELLIPVVQQVVEWLTSLANKISSLDEDQKKLIIRIAAVAAAVGPVLVVIGKVISTVATVVTWIIKIIKFIKDFIAIAKIVLAAINPIVLIIAAVVAALVLLWNYCDGFREAVIEIATTIRDAVVNAFNAVIDFFKNFPTHLSNMIQSVKDWGVNLYTTFTTWVSDTVEAVVTWFQELPGRIYNAILTTIARIQQWGQNVKQTFSDWVTNTIEAVIDFFQKLPYRIGYAIGFTIAKIITWGKNIKDTFTEWVTNTIEAVVTFFTELPGKIYNAIVDTIARVTEWATNLYETFTTWAIDTIVAVQVFFSELPGRIWDAIVDTFNRVREWGSRVWNSFKEWVTKTITDVVNFFKELPGKIYNAIVDTIDRVVEWGKNLVKTAIEVGKDFAENLIDTVKGLPDRFFSIGKDIVMGVWNGIQNMAKWFTDQVKNFFGGIVDGVKGALGINSPAKAMIPIGEGVVEGTEVGIENKEDDLLKTSRSISDTILNGAKDSNVTHTIRNNTNTNDQLQTLSSSLTDSLRAFTQGQIGIAQTNTETDIIKTISSKDSVEQNQPTIQIDQIIVRNDDDLQKVSQGLFKRDQNVLRALGTT